MTKFKSKGMQRATFFYIGTKKLDYKSMYTQLGYWNPENRITLERLEILHDSEKLLVVLTPKKVICQFENN